LFAESPNYTELALVFADPLSLPFTYDLPKVLLTRIGVSYLTSEKPELYKDMYVVRDLNYESYDISSLLFFVFNCCCLKKFKLRAIFDDLFKDYINKNLLF
jgi:hypothetical protein